MASPTLADLRSDFGPSPPPSLPLTSALYQLRRFKNSDPPALAEIWNRQQPQRGMVQPVSSAVLEQFVFSKQIFDPQGLIVAEQEGRVVGFAHGSFGSNDAGNGQDFALGVTQMLLMHPEFATPDMSRDLLAGSEEYLRSRGAKVLYGGGIPPLDAFYLGMYGGSELSGVLASDPPLNLIFQDNGYEVACESAVMHLELALLKPTISREQRALRQKSQLDHTFSLPIKSWWEANRLGDVERQRFTLSPKRSPETLASVEFWDIEPLAASWGIRTSGLWNLFVHEDHRRKKLASCLLSEAFKTLRKRGVSLIEAHTMRENEAAMALYHSLGFTQVDAGYAYRKPG